MRRRLDLAASLVAVPQVLFLDEPTTGLDPRSRGDLWDILRDLVRDGTTIILTTQYLDEADKLADDIVVLDHGRTVAQGSPDDLKARIGDDRIDVKVPSVAELDHAARAMERFASTAPTFDRDELIVSVPLVDGRLADGGHARPRRLGRRRPRPQPPSGHARRRLPDPDRPRPPDRRRCPMTAVTDAVSPVVPSHDWSDAYEERGALATLWSDAVVYAGRNIAHIRQIPEKLLDVTVQPLMFVLLFAYVFGGAIGVSGGSYREYVIAGILLQSLAFGLTGPATAISTDLTEGVIDRFRSLPASRAAYLLGHYLAELAGMALSIVVLLSAGLVVGWRTHTGVGHVTGALLLLLLFASAMIWIGTWIGLTVRSTDAVMGVGFVVVFPLTFLSSAFVPINTLSPVLQHIAAWNPVSVMVGAVRVMFGNPTAPVDVHSWPLEHPVPAAFLYCIVLLAVAVPASLRRFRSRTSD